MNSAEQVNVPDPVPTYPDKEMVFPPSGQVTADTDDQDQTTNRLPPQVEVSEKDPDPPAGLDDLQIGTLRIKIDQKLDFIKKQCSAPLPCTLAELKRIDTSCVYRCIASLIKVLVEWKRLTLEDSSLYRDVYKEGVVTARLGNRWASSVEEAVEKLTNTPDPLGLPVLTMDGEYPVDKFFEKFDQFFGSTPPDCKVVFLLAKHMDPELQIDVAEFDQDYEQVKKYMLDRFNQVPTRTVPTFIADPEPDNQDQVDTDPVLPQEGWYDSELVKPCPLN